MTALMSWPAADDTKPYPWHDVDCPSCGEPEMAAARGFGPEDFVCMVCGLVTKLEARP